MNIMNIYIEMRTSAVCDIMRIYDMCIYVQYDMHL